MDLQNAHSMAPKDPTPCESLQHLENQLAALRTEYGALQKRYEEQALRSQAWLAQRTSDMEREARDLRKAQTLKNAY